MWAAWALLTAVTSLAEAAPLPAAPSPCPDPDELETRLRELGVAGESLPEVNVADDRMRVVLRGRDGLLLGSREVAAPASCQERANVAAVLVATWMGVWRPAGADAKPPAPPPPTVARPPASDRHGDGGGVGIVLMSAFDGNAFASGLALEARWRLAGPLLGTVGLSATTERDKAVGAGRAGYTRPTLEVGPSLRLGSGDLRVELALGGRLGVLILRGKDLPITHVTARVLPGLAAGLRLVFVGKSISPFVTGGVAYWLGREDATLDDAPANAELPRWDAQVGLGLDWARGP